ncbi:probable G-protein coupled receptor 171 [Protopterus annectens]|uniref:probable G-protein coupled receptor 171 n=1 Tax=Protopterus annectens TaxID=7888 RepID=UPI001CF9B5BC|nr:probable G-protein coupled receptor 171 [Protopterus annectens]
MENANHSDCTINKQMEPFTYFYYLIFLIGFIGSCIALWAFIHKDKNRMCMNIYLINLLTADFLLTLALPFKIAVDLGIAPWTLKIFHCQVTACLIYINMYASIIFLGFVSMDRYLQISTSSKFFRIQELGFAKMLSVVVWGLVLLIMVPNMLIPIKSINEKPMVSCMEFKTKIGMHWHVLTNFICVTIFINFSTIILISNCLVFRKLYKRNDQNYINVKRAMLNILILTAVYVVCFVPYHIVRIPYTLSQSDVITDCSQKQSLFWAKESTLLLAVLSLCFDPLLYFHMSNTFRVKIKETFLAPGDNSNRKSSTDRTKL